MKQKAFDNPSGIAPTLRYVLLLPDPVPDTVGAIAMPDTVIEKEQMKQIKCTLIAAGGNAFEEWAGIIPKPGDHVYTVRYAGIRELEGRDGRFYQMVHDRDVFAVIEEE